jgi:hypothetical protein
VVTQVANLVVGILQVALADRLGDVGELILQVAAGAWIAPVFWALTMASRRPSSALAGVTGA